MNITLSMTIMDDDEPVIQQDIIHLSKSFHPMQVRGLSMQRELGSVCFCMAKPCLGRQWCPWGCCEFEGTGGQNALLKKSQVQSAMRSINLETQKTLVNLIKCV